MVDYTGESGTPDQPERVAQNSELLKGGWERTVADMRAMAKDREEKGFTTLTVPAGDTAPKTPEMGETDRWGLSHMIPGNKTDRFHDLYEGGEFTDTGVYQMSDRGFVFVVTECIDLRSRAVIFFAGTYEMRNAAALVRTAVDRGEMYTHVRTIDGTHIGTFEHDDVEAFFPDPDAYFAYEPDY